MPKKTDEAKLAKIVDGVVHGIVHGVVCVVKGDIGKGTNDHCNEKEDVDGFKQTRLNGRRR